MFRSLKLLSTVVRMLNTGWQQCVVLQGCIDITSKGFCWQALGKNQRCEDSVLTKQGSTSPQGWVPTGAVYDKSHFTSFIMLFAFSGLQVMPVCRIVRSQNKYAWVFIFYGLEIESVWEFFLFDCLKFGRDGILIFWLLFFGFFKTTPQFSLFTASG